MRNISGKRRQNQNTFYRQ